MTSTDHPHLDERVRERRARLKRMGIGLAAMVGVMLLLLLIVLLNAGRWGVPMFSFTNERGSHCRNDFLGSSCNQMTLEDIKYRAEVDLPADTRVLLSNWKETHDFELTARMVLPKESAQQGWETLNKKFGDCRKDLASPLAEIPNLSGLCVMSSEDNKTLEGTRNPRVWQISTASQQDGSTLVHMYIKSR